MRLFTAPKQARAARRPLGAKASESTVSMQIVKAAKLAAAVMLAPQKGLYGSIAVYLAQPPRRAVAIPLYLLQSLRKPKPKTLVSAPAKPKPATTDPRVGRSNLKKVLGYMSYSLHSLKGKLYKGLYRV